MLEGLEFMGVELDNEVNSTCRDERLISTPNSKVKVFVIPTNEELMIAMDTAALAK
jgi:acetate kinase